jgi:5-formyltetrahydrofolate cyclo-ligase
MHDKQHLRSAITARRAARDPAEIAAAGAAIGGLARAVIGDAALVAAFIGVGAEPPTDPLIAECIRLGARVLVPAVRGHALEWSEYGGPDELVQSPLGLLEPAGPRSGPEAIADCELIVVPALAVDRHGHRLGRGGGFYDRALPLAPAARAFAVVYDDEVLDEVPVEAHDARVAGALTPGGMLSF